ncbi:MAG: HTTM domain-containing protein [Candidatus Hydrogenedentes bacterium]|nr:HTTM domain-containing protein [Candidatus Hydrogenedentota bacterium]
MLITAIKARIRSVIEIDYRALAALRISLAAVIIVDLINRAQALTAHYTDRGVYPRAFWIEDQPNRWFFSLHLLGGETVHQAALFLAAGVAAALLLAGYRTRLMTVISWLLILSLHNRNQLVLQSGDTLLRMLLFWSIFLPLGAKYSVDALRAHRAPGEKSARSAATFAILVQVCLVYWFTVLHRTDPMWWNGKAVYYALHLDLFATPLGVWLRQYDGVCTALTYFSIGLELLGPVLVFSPILTRHVRLVVVVLMVIMHMGFALTMKLGLFPVISIAGWIVFIPTHVWDRLDRARLLSALKTKLVTLAAPFAGDAATPRAPAPELNNDLRAFPIEVNPRRIANAACLMLLAYVFCWNVSELTPQFALAMPREYRPLGYLLKLHQDWSMFSPRPTRNDGWFVIEAERINGEKIDLMTGNPPVWEKPELVSRNFPSQRWRKYMMNLREKKYSDHLLYYGRYLTRAWNAKLSGDERINTFDIYFMRETTDYPTVEAPTKVHLWRHNCFAKPPPAENEQQDVAGDGIDP